MEIFDVNGKRKNWEWVKEKYNLPEIERASKELDHWEILELRERIGPVAMRIRAVGKIVCNVPFLIEWPGDHIVEVTGFLGYADFILGAYYRPPNVGPYMVRVSDPPIPSDVIRGLGMLGKTNHAHLEPTFAFMKGEELPPAPTDCKEYISALERIREEIDSICPR